MRHKVTSYAFSLLVLILTVSSMVACAGKPEPVLQWSRTFGGLHNDQGRSAQQTTDGGYIVCGIAESYGAGGEDVWLIKTDAEGNKLWDKTFGGERDDIGISAQQTTEGGYIVCGSTKSYAAGTGDDDDEDVWLIKTDAEGSKLWDKTFGGNGYNAGRSVQQTTDGGYIICGYREPYGEGNGRAWLIKTDAEGNRLWDRTFGGEGRTIATSVRQTTDGGYIVCGFADLHETGKAEVLLVRTDAAGNQLWEKKFAYNDDATGNSVQQTSDGGYIICGTTAYYETGAVEVLFIKTDAAGNQLWEKTFGGKDGAMGTSAQQATDGGYIVCGTTTSSETNKEEVWLIKTDAKGNKLWDETFGGEWSAEVESVQQTTDGGYIISGTAYSEGSRHLLLMKITPEQ